MGNNRGTFKTEFGRTYDEVADELIPTLVISYRSAELHNYIAFDTSKVTVQEIADSLPGVYASLNSPTEATQERKES